MDEPTTLLICLITIGVSYLAFQSPELHDRLLFRPECILARKGTLGKGQKRVKSPPIAPRRNPADGHGSIQLPAIDEEVAEMLARRLCFVDDLAFDADIAV